MTDREDFHYRRGLVMGASMSSDAAWAGLLSMALNLWAETNLAGGATEHQPVCQDCGKRGMRHTTGCPTWWKYRQLSSIAESASNGKETP